MKVDSGNAHIQYKPPTPPDADETTRAERNAARRAKAAEAQAKAQAEKAAKEAAAKEVEPAEEKKENIRPERVDFLAESNKQKARIKTLLKFLNTDNEKSLEELRKQIMELRRQQLEGMFKRIQMMSPKDYTDKSWRACMAAYKKSMVMAGVKSATPASLNKAIAMMRSGLASLRRREKDQKGGSKAERDAAENEAALRIHAANEKYDRDQAMVAEATANAEAASAEAGAPAPAADVTIV